jgi:hypothetical protein
MTLVFVCASSFSSINKRNRNLILIYTFSQTRREIDQYNTQVRLCKARTYFYQSYVTYLVKEHYFLRTNCVQKFS